MPMQYAKSISKSAVGILRNEAIIAVLSASIVAPFVIPKINSLLDSVPILRDHKSIASFVTGMAVFSIAGTVARNNMILRAVIIGIAGAFILSALLPIYSSLTSKAGAMP
jgi:hypothetical protein